MRALAGLLAVALFLASGCRRPTPRVDTIEDGNEPALSVLPMGHPAAARQLVSGVWAVEDGTWRWTSHRFVIALEPPPAAASNGARLELDLTVPEVVLARRKSVTLSAAVENTPLAPETYTTSGPRRYIRDVPAAALANAPVRVTFTLDHFLKAGEVESRELGIVLNRAALLSK